jgi:hypothetical protein
MGVVRRDVLRRWSVTGAGVAALCLLPVAVAAWPADSASSVDPVVLRQRILASVNQPYSGHVSTDGRLALPALPALEDVRGLLAGSARLRTWYVGPTSWRVAELTTTGERDTYRTTAGLDRWDFERNLITHLAGAHPVGLPDASDLVPPTLARRLLGAGGRLDPLPVRRVAGVDAAGLALTPDDPDTAISRVQVWAEPRTGLPLRVEVMGEGSADPVIASRFLQLRRAAPDPAVVAPTVPAGAGFTEVTDEEAADALANALRGRLPAMLAGRPRMSTGVTDGVTGGGLYGAGFSAMVVLALPGRAGGRTLAAARDNGGTPVALSGAQAYELRAPPLAALVVRTDGDRSRPRTWLLTGLVDPRVLHRAAAELIGQP